MDEFALRVQEWQTFYATIAASSATLVGLLFVALSVNPEAWNRAKNSGITSLALQTFTTFLYVIGIALTFLVPRQAPPGVGLPLVLISLLGLRVTFAELIASRRGSGPQSGTRSTIRRAVLKIAAFALLAAIAVQVLWMGDAGILGLMVAPMIILLISASLNTWDLLVAFQDASANR